jgi:hypothetical protein
VQGDDGADDGRRGRFESGFFCPRRDRPEVRDHDALAAGRPPFDRRRRLGGISARIDQSPRCRLEGGNAHEQHDRLGTYRQGCRIPLVGAFLARGQHHERRRQPSMGHRDAGIGWHGHRRAHAGDDLEGDRRLPEQ